MIENNNPPEMKVRIFSKNKKLIILIVFQMRVSGWDKSNLEIENNILKIKFRDKFNTRRGRVNCSIKDDQGWRWFGVQFVLKNIKDN